MDEKAMHTIEFKIRKVDGYKRPSYYFDHIFFEAFKCHNEFAHKANVRITNAFNDGHYVRARREYAIKSKELTQLGKQKKKSEEEKESSEKLKLVY